MQQDLFQKKGDRLGLQTKIPFDMLHIDCARNAVAQLVERQTGDLRVVCSSHCVFQLHITYSIQEDPS